MTKKLFVLFASAAFLFGAASCEKCVTCSYDAAGIAVSEEFCSKDSDDRDTFEASMEAAAALLGTNANCTTD